MTSSSRWKQQSRPRPDKRRKIFGYYHGDGWVRVYVSIRDPDWDSTYPLEADVILNPGIIPDDLPAGTCFTLHYRGAKLLYGYVIDKPKFSRRQLKRARIKARIRARQLLAEVSDERQDG